MQQVVIVTGGSSGIGLATARAFRAAGCMVYELSRRDVVHQDGIVHIGGDVTDEKRVREAVEEVESAQGRVDILVCNAGFGISGAAEFTENQDAKQLLDVNLFGMVNAVKAVVPGMRRRRAGRILCISSIAAAVPIPFQAWYSVSKAAVSAYAGALRQELLPFGIQVCAILPGDIHSGFTGHRVKSPVGDDIYGGRISRSVAVMEHDEQTGMSPEQAAKAIACIAFKGHMKPGYAIGLPYKGVMLLLRILPGEWISRIVGHMYAR